MGTDRKRLGAAIAPLPACDDEEPLAGRDIDAGVEPSGCRGYGDGRLRPCEVAAKQRDRKKQGDRDPGLSHRTS